MMLMYGDQDPMKVQIDTIYDMFDSVRPVSGCGHWSEGRGKGAGCCPRVGSARSVADMGLGGLCMHGGFQAEQAKLK